MARRRRRALEGVDVDAKVRVGVIHDGQRAADPDRDGQFLPDFTLQGGFERFAASFLAAGEFPEAAEQILRAYACRSGCGRPGRSRRPRPCSRAVASWARGWAERFCSL